MCNILFFKARKIIFKLKPRALSLMSLLHMTRFIVYPLISGITSVSTDIRRLQVSEQKRLDRYTPNLKCIVSESTLLYSFSCTLGVAESLLLVCGKTDLSVLQTIWGNKVIMVLGGKDTAADCF